MGERHELKQSQKNFKTFFRILKPSRFYEYLPGTKVLFCPPFLICKITTTIKKKNKKPKTALVSYALPEKYKETNKEKTQSVCPQVCRSQIGWNGDWWLRLLKYNPITSPPTDQKNEPPLLFIGPWKMLCFLSLQYIPMSIYWLCRQASQVLLSNKITIGKVNLKLRIQKS